MLPIVIPFFGFASFPVEQIFHKQYDPLFTSDTGFTSLVLVVMLITIFSFRRSSSKSLDSNKRKKWRITTYLFSALLLALAVLALLFIISLSKHGGIHIS